MKNAVLACHLEVLALAALDVRPHSAVVENDVYGIVLYRHLLEGWRLASHALHAVSLAESLICQAFAGKLFLFGMDAFLESGIHKASHSAVAYLLQSQNLLLAKICGVVYRLTFLGNYRIVIRCYLAIVERKIAYAPLRAPSANHRCHHVAVCLGTIPVVLALIPYRAAYSVADDRVQHSVV